MTDVRRTIAQETTLEGVGLHLGQPCRLTFRPGRVGEGIYFVRSELRGSPRVRAIIDNAVQTERRTQLGEGADAIHTVEHVLAAIAGNWIDDLAIMLDGPEPPIMDGSAGPFHRALNDAGIANNGGRPNFVPVKEAFTLDVGDSQYEVFPADELLLDVRIDFPHPLIAQQQGRYTVSREVFARELADARTFGFADEVEHLRGRGLIRGGSTSNAIVLGDNGVIENTLRWPDEFVRHKALDMVGDLALAGARVRAHIVAHRPSHRATVSLVREIIHRARTESTKVIGVEQIIELLPHRYPFLLVDRVVEYEEGARIVGIKNVTINEHFFQGHFPGNPVMPGVLILEAMAQAGGILLFNPMPPEERGRKVVYFTAINNAKFRRSVRPGDQLRMELTVVHMRGPYVHMHGVAKVDGKIACEADVAATVRDR